MTGRVGIDFCHPYGSVDHAVTATGKIHNSIANDQDHPVPSEVTSQSEPAGHNEDAPPSGVAVDSQVSVDVVVSPPVGCPPVDRVAHVGFDRVDAINQSLES